MNLARPIRRAPPDRRRRVSVYPFYRNAALTMDRRPEIEFGKLKVGISD